MANNHSRLLASVVSDPAEIKRLEPLTHQRWDPEAIALGARAAYLWCPNGVIESQLAEALNWVLGDAVTSRNWATILKLQDLVRAGDSEKS